MSQRPVFLNLLQIRFPVTAIVSIGHRVTGILMIFSLPLWLWLLQHTLTSAESYARVLLIIDQVMLFKLALFVSIISVWYHVFAGIRHIVMDFGFGESMQQARVSAWLVLILTFFSALFLVNVIF